ncbi:MAG: DUF3887 domain-containing protein [Anaerolineaceae bacterium]|nr:DUF3887 domain-containing protein [Anaerolineaceae bacterium]
MKRVLTFILFVLLLVGSLSACGANPNKTLAGADQEAVLAYADPIADNLLKGMNDRDYASFSRDFNDAMIKGIPEAGFPQMEDSILGKIGKYVSRQVSSVIETGGIETVIYTAKFEQEDSVTIRLAVEKAEPHKVAGLFFTSPKLAGK